MIKAFELIPKNLNLSKKMSILLLTIFIAGLIIWSGVFFNISWKSAENELKSKANLLISIMDSVRKYNNDNINPLLQEQSDEKFLVESIPSFAVRSVFDILTNVYQDEYGKYAYKDAMLNPTNPKDKATNEEMKIIGKLEQQDGIVENNIDKGFLMIKGENKFYTARPITITQSSCLRCHTSLKQSPQSLQALYEQGQYKEPQGFGWELHKVIGTKIIYISAQQVYQIAVKKFMLSLGIFTAIFIVAIFLTNLWLQQYVVKPINKMTQVADAVSLGDLDAEFPNKSNDEIGRLAEAFTRLKISFVIAMRRLTQKSN